MMTSDATNAANAVIGSRPVGSCTPAISAANALGRLTARNRGTNFRDVFITGRGICSGRAKRNEKSQASELQAVRPFTLLVWRCGMCALWEKHFPRVGRFERTQRFSGDVPNDRPRITRTGANFG